MRCNDLRHLAAAGGVDELCDSVESGPAMLADIDCGHERAKNLAEFMLRNVGAMVEMRVTAGLAIIVLCTSLAGTAAAAPNLCIENPSKVRNSATHAFYHGNYASAFRQFKTDASRGNAFAQMKLGIMYRMGYGVPQNFAKAVKWWRSAAAGGNANAQCNLGFMYLYGVAVEQDPVLAYAWFNIAAGQGHRDARAKRDIVASWRLNSEQLLEAQRVSSGLIGHYH